MTTTTTTVIIPGRAPMAGIPGTKDANWVRTTYGSEINLSSYTAEERNEGSVHIVEFKPRTGTKGVLAAAA